MNWETVLCIGDSITIGARSYLAYPDYLSHSLKIETGTEWSVINNAISGYMCRDICRNLCENISNIKSQNPSVATILIGTNDIKNGTPIDLFEISYEQLLLKTKLLIPHQNIFLILIPQFTKGIKYPYKYEMNKEVIKFNKLIRKIALKHQLSFIELNIEEHQLTDGVHLNEQGSKEVAQQILPFILTDKGYENTPSKS